MIKKAILLLLLIGLFISCELMYKSKEETLSDSRFNGVFSTRAYEGYSGHYPYNGTYIGKSWVMWKFLGTTKARYAVVKELNWLDGDDYYADKEIKLSGGHLYSKVWDNGYSDFNDDGEYSFDEEGNLLLKPSYLDNPTRYYKQ